ncbi:hypothetical protein LWI29_024060 [Acer saccharum]|uniref:RNase H type-1 domain-containing protein n=1 Tax=Acer saccharum TaxID=4024 RepID=A0AA39T605_ACESA|nr:hypothetical protein LWI29_024060 [Acer saccharum]
MEEIKKKIQACGDRLVIWNGEKRMEFKRDIVARRKALREFSNINRPLSWKKLAVLEEKLNKAVNTEERLSKGELELFCVTIWKVWCTRNDWMHNGRKYDMSEMVWWSRNYIDEIRRVQPNGEKDVVNNGRSSEVVEACWRPPDHGMLKINYDARMDKRRRRVGFGIIVRDEVGKVLRCWAQGCEANYDIDSANAMAIYKGLMVGRDMGLVNFTVESDSEVVIKHIVNGDNSDVVHGSILDSIQGLVSDTRNVVFNCVLSKANMVAYALAIEALRVKDVVVWKEDAPVCIRAQIKNDQRSFGAGSGCC